MIIAEMLLRHLRLSLGDRPGRPFNYYARRILLSPIVHARSTLTAVTVTAIVGGIFGLASPSKLSYRASDFYSHSSDSFRVSAELEPRDAGVSDEPPNLAVIVQRTPHATNAVVEPVLAHLPEVETVAPYIFPSRNAHASMVFAWLRSDFPEGTAAATVARALDRPGVIVGGSALARYQFGEEIKNDMTRAELLAFPLLILLGLWVFRSGPAALLPALVGGIALACALGCIRVLNELFPLSIFSLDIVLALTLGLGVDYSLLMLSRFRDELSVTRLPAAAAWSTMSTAGRTIACSCTAIALSFASLLVFPIPFVRSMAVGGILVALLSGGTALLVPPALFTLFGLSIAGRSCGNNFFIRQNYGVPSHWQRVSRLVTRRPVTTALASSVLLIALGLPLLSMRFTGLDVGSLPASSDTRIFTEEARRAFDHPVVGEIQLALRGARSTALAAQRAVSRLGVVTRQAIPFPVAIQRGRHLWQFDLNPTAHIFSRLAVAFVRRLRDLGRGVGVSGETAEYIDTAATLRRDIPYAVGILVVAVMVSVLLGTGSVVLALKALVMNTMSLAAAFGVVVTVFQQGLLRTLLAYQPQGALVVTLPVVMGASAFALLTDYGLFLLTRVREARDAGYTNREAIALGVERTGRVITGAALLFCVAVGALTTSGIIFIKEAAVGIVVAVGLDVLVVRPLLAPSLMVLLGRWNWWPAFSGDRFLEGSEEGSFPA